MKWNQPIENDPAWFGSSYQKRSPNLILLNWSPTRHLNVGPIIASPSFLSNSPPMYKSKFSIAPYNCCSLGTSYDTWNGKISIKLNIPLMWTYSDQQLCLTSSYKVTSGEATIEAYIFHDFTLRSPHSCLHLT